MSMNDEPAERGAVEALRTLGGELEALSDDHPRVHAMNEALRHCKGEPARALGETALDEWASRPDSGARRVEGAVAFEGAYRQRESAGERVGHQVEVAFPGSRDWCEAWYESLTGLYASMSDDPNAGGMLGIVPAVALEEPEDDDDLWELCLTWVQVPAAGAWLAAQRAMSVLELVSPDLASLPGLRVVAANTEAELDPEDAD